MAVSAATHCPLCLPEVLHPEGDERGPAIIFLDMDGVMKWGDTKLESVIERFPDLLDLGEGYLAFVKKRSQLAGREIDPWETSVPSSKKPLWEENYFDFCFTVVKGRQLNKDSLGNLQQLITRVEAAGKRALVVISSAWRGDATTRELREEVFDETAFGSRICGKAAPGHSSAHHTPEYKYGGVDFVKHALEKHGLNLHDRADEIEYWLKDHNLKGAPFVILDDRALEREGNRFGERFVRITNRFDQAIVDKAFAQLCPKAEIPDAAEKGE